jgi:hypothetical protein
MTDHDAVPISASELTELRKDAQRYRWLRQWVPDQNALEDHMAELGISQPMSPAGLDAALDTAIAAELPTPP